jgi:predicted nucleic acid-binding protein
MIVLDTNVLSEAIRPVPTRRVLDWLAAQPPRALFMTTISEAEFLYGLALLPTGKRRTSLEQAARRMFEEDFAQRVLPFDRAAAAAFASIAAVRRKRGRPIGDFDAQIAAIARIHGAAVATRNVDDFRDCGIEVVDPWAA